MNKHDKSQLEFLMHLDSDMLANWFNSTSEDDHEYAMEILAAARAECALKLIELSDDVDDVSDARQVLRKFMR